MLGLHDLGRDTEADITGLLDATVSVGITITYNQDQEVRSSLVTMICQ